MSNTTAPEAAHDHDHDHGPEQIDIAQYNALRHTLLNDMEFISAMHHRLREVARNEMLLSGLEVRIHRAASAETRLMAKVLKAGDTYSLQYHAVEENEWFSTHPVGPYFKPTHNLVNAITQFLRDHKPPVGAEMFIEYVTPKPGQWEATAAAETPEPVAAAPQAEPDGGDPETAEAVDPSTPPGEE